MFHSFVFLALAASPPASAAPIAPTAVVQADPIALAAAERFLDALGYDRMIERMVDQMGEQMRSMLKTQLEQNLGQSFDDELIDRMNVVQKRHIRSQLVGNKRLRLATSALYAKHFTVPELDRMTVLMADPAMKRWNELAPTMMADLLPLVIADSSAGEGALKTEVIKVVTDYLEEKQGGS